GFDVYRHSTGKIERLVSDIQSISNPVRTINDIFVAGNRIYLATGFGISIYLPKAGVFGSTAEQISGQRDDSVRQVIEANGYIFAAMQEGVASIPSNADITNNRNWTLARDSSAVRSLAMFHGSVYAGTTSGLFMLAPDRVTLS